MAQLADRRAFLRRGALAVGALGAGGGLAGCTAERTPKPAATPRFDPADWESVRAQFELPRDQLDFSAFVLAAHPAPVRAAVERHRQGLDAGGVGYLHAHEREAERQLRGAAAEYLHAAEAEVAFTGSTTEGLGLLYGGLRLRPGDDVVTTEHDFYSTHEALRLNAAASGATVRRIRLYGDPARASAGQMVAAVRAAVRPRTRVVALTWVHSSTGVMVPVGAVAAALAETNARRAHADRVLLCVDGVHGLGADATSPADLGCDFLVSGTHKWLFGPRGTGIIWGRALAWPAVRPVVPSFADAAFAGWLAGVAPAGSPGELATPGGYHAFEHRWALAEAFRFHLAVGKDRVAARTRDQASRLKEGLAGLAHVRLVTPRDPALSAGIVCCAIEGRDPGGVVARLRDEHRILASVTPYRDEYVRFGPSIVTTPDDVDRVVRAVAALR